MRRWPTGPTGHHDFASLTEIEDHVRRCPDHEREATRAESSPPVVLADFKFTLRMLEIPQALLPLCFQAAGDEPILRLHGAILALGSCYPKRPSQDAEEYSTWLTHEAC